ncbi:hypothetical protein M0804_008508 [Polistes exclamans]|nr:hypothetical protein M0804_008508 [Polistes exclamans]
MGIIGIYAMRWVVVCNGNNGAARLLLLLLLLLLMLMLVCNTDPDLPQAESQCVAEECLLFSRMRLDNP